MRLAIPIVLATVLTGCAAESPSREASTGEQGDGDGASDPGNGANATYQAVSTGYPTSSCWDCDTYEGQCRNEADDGYVCGSRPSGFCGPTCSDLCVCPENLECVGATCKPRACNTMDASQIADCSQCTQAECCDELEACFAEPDGCLDASGDIRVDTQEGRDLRDCQMTSCADACNVVCGELELATDDHESAECANDQCCGALGACHGHPNSPEWDACMACIESGGGEQCEAFLSCMERCAA